LSGVRTYFYDNPPPGSQVAQRVAQQRNEKRERGPGMTIMASGVSQ